MMIRILKLAVAAALLVLPVTAARAQRIGNFKQKLAVPAVNESLHTTSRVVVTEYGSAATAVRQADTAVQSDAVNGFRIVIFFDNGSTARADAEATITAFNSMYPDVHSQIDYENPYFKVLVGSCLTSEEAIVLLGRVRNDFPKAYITRESIKFSELVQANEEF